MESITATQMINTNSYHKENTHNQLMAAKAASYLSESTCAGTPVEL